MTQTQLNQLNYLELKVNHLEQLLNSVYKLEHGLTLDQYDRTMKEIILNKLKESEGDFLDYMSNKQSAFSNSKKI